MPATTIHTLSPPRPKRKRSNSSSPDCIDDTGEHQQHQEHQQEAPPPPKRRPWNLKIEIPNVTVIPLPLDDGGLSTTSSSSLPSILSEHNSLFDEDDVAPTPTYTPALLMAPPIPGLFFDPSLLLPQELADSVMTFCLETYFCGKTSTNQVMLFGRSPSSSLSSIADSCNDEGNDNDSSTSSSTSSTSSTSTPPPPPTDSDANVGLPSTLINLLHFLQTFLEPHLPNNTYQLLFPNSNPTCSRQAIINLYHPGEGISPHVDLLKRYGDGIVGVSFGSGCVMQFAKEVAGVAGVDGGLGDEEKERWGLYLPERSVVVLSEEARYQWTHGIERKKSDYVACSDGGTESAVANGNGKWIERGMRVSVTFRWMLPGADVVGCEDA